MSSRMIASVNSIKTWVMSSKGRMVKIAKGSGTAGTRAAPTQSGTNDEKMGGRLDFGERFEKDGKVYCRFNFQLNKNAENKTLRDLARDNTHKKWSSAEIEISENPTEDEAREKATQLFDSIISNLQKP
ncbi:TPA_exp: Uncharacterized protein A8136_5436 [Trichophyton benhamiae CBS 112371]|nr:TPA_exp: Uncharacterized protein A8136_5436 [Trichophyton benhamiae CBS 112371]